MADNFKERFDIAVGKAATIVGEAAEKAANFVNEQKDKAVTYLDSKKELYNAKYALDEANKKLDNLFNELGRVSYYKKSTVPGRKSDDIRKEIKSLLSEVDALQEKYDSLKPVTEDADDDIDDDNKEDEEE